MATENHIKTVEALMESWNSHDLERIASYLTPDFENHQAPFAPVIGRDAYLKHCAHWFEAFPDFSIEAVTLFGSGDLVCLESLAVGTNREEFFGNAPANDRQFVAACDVLIFKGEKIALERGYWDFSRATGKPAPAALDEPVSATNHNA